MLLPWGVVFSCFFSFAAHEFHNLKRRIVLFVVKNFTYPYFLARHRFIGPWSRAFVCLNVIYAAANITCLAFQASTISEVGLAAATLSLVNAMPLFAGPHFSYLADLFGFPLGICKNIHCSAGTMSFLLALFHVLTMLSTAIKSPAIVAEDMFAIIVSLV